MMFASKTSAILVAFVLSSASGALAQERCTGTLCDYYYGNAAPAAAPASGAQTTAPAGATPLTVPSGGILGFFSRSPAQPAAPGTTQGATAPAARPLVGVGGGGVAAMARGEQAERCTGTLCDWYYGGPPPERPADQPGAAAIDPQTAPGTETAAEATADETPAPARRRRTVVEETPRCAATAQDPWKCYR